MLLSTKWLITKEDIPELLKESKSTLTQQELEFNIIEIPHTFPQSQTPFIDSYELANLDLKWEKKLENMWPKKTIDKLKQLSKNLWKREVKQTEEIEELHDILTNILDEYEKKEREEEAKDEIEKIYEILKKEGLDEEIRKLSELWREWEKIAEEMWIEKVKKPDGSWSDKSEVSREYIELAGLKVMKNNFRVDSTGWKEKEVTWVLKWKEQKIKVKYHVNDKGKEDIWEYLDGEFVWEQLFTWDAAKREVDKVKWIRMIKEWEKEEEKEWSKIIKACWWETKQKQSRNTVDKLWIKFCGYRNPRNGKFRNIGYKSLYWLPQSSDGRALYIWFKDLVWGNDQYDKVFGFSLRCAFQD